MPAVVALVAHGVDLASGSPLIIRSLLGVNPRSGSRFYGLGNELEATLVVLLIVALGALLMRRADFESRARRSARGRGARAAPPRSSSSRGSSRRCSSARASSAPTSAASSRSAAASRSWPCSCCPGTPSRAARSRSRCLAPLLAVVGLALLDLATGGNGHFTRTILEADSAGALWDVVARRYTLAFNVLKTGAMPFITVLAVLAAAYAVRYRERIYAPLRGSPAWRAALAGGLAASIVGAAFNDSGPILLVFGVFVLACVTAYVRGRPEAGARR